MSKEPIQIIAVSGPAGHGKGTVGKALDLFHGYTVVSLANVFKHELALFEDGALIKEIEVAGFTVRRGWQQAGGEARQRFQFRDLWCERLWSWLVYLAEFHPEPRRRFAVCDFRQVEEEAFFRSQLDLFGEDAQYLQVDVEWPGKANRAGGSHKSETDRSKLHPDIRLLNDGSKRDLARAVDALLPGGWKFAGRGALSTRPYPLSASALSSGTETL